MTNSRFFTVLALFAVAAVSGFSGCGGSDYSSGDSSTATSPDTSSTAAEAPAPAASGPAQGGKGQTVTVDIKDFMFDPESITVKAGSEITWTNSDNAAHTATADDNSFDTGSIAQGATGVASFDSPGTFAYICDFHPFMKGTVVVE